MSGTVNISRGLFDSEAFRDEPLTEREAWVWMVMAASWKDRAVRAGDYLVETKRGQLAHSIRYMAKAWQWTPAKAQRYLKRVEKLKMIRVETDTGVSVITICKYDEYQNGGKAADTGPIQDRYRTDTEKKKDERREEGKEDTDVSLSLAIDPIHANDASQAVTRYNEAASKAGWPQVQKLNPTRSKQLRQRLKDCGGIEGWEQALIKAFESDFCRGRTTKPWQGFGFDWLTKSANFTKLMEGNYDNRIAPSGSAQRHAQGSQNRADPALEQIARLAGLG